MLVNLFIISIAHVFLNNLLLVNGMKDKASLRIGGVFPLLNPDGTAFILGAERLAGFIMAIKDINANTEILKDVTVEYAVRDSRTSFVNTVLAALDLVNDAFKPKSVSAVIGAKDDSVTGALSSYLSGVDIVQISYGSTAAELSDSDLYPTLLRMVPSDAYQGDLYYL